MDGRSFRRASLATHFWALSSFVWADEDLVNGLHVQWTKVTDEPKGSAYVDLTSVKRDGHRFRAWIKLTPKKPFASASTRAALLPTCQATT